MNLPEEMDIFEARDRNGRRDWLRAKGGWTDESIPILVKTCELLKGYGYPIHSELKEKFKQCVASATANANAMLIQTAEDMRNCSRLVNAAKLITDHAKQIGISTAGAKGPSKCRCVVSLNIIESPKHNKGHTRTSGHPSGKWTTRKAEATGRRLPRSLPCVRRRRTASTQSKWHRLREPTRRKPRFLTS